jgi:hypothetical protein
MRGATIQVTADLITETCCRSDCGILFAVPADWQARKRRDHTNFYCPNGHDQHYVGKTEEEKLKEELKRTRENLEWHRERGDRLADDNMTLARSRTALRGVVTKLRRKAASGECAYCHERFPDVAAHVAELHPDVQAEASDADEEPDANGV